jgi:hypothetical protein
MSTISRFAAFGTAPDGKVTDLVKVSTFGGTGGGGAEDDVVGTTGGAEDDDVVVCTTGGAADDECPVVGGGDCNEDDDTTVDNVELLVPVVLEDPVEVVGDVPVGSVELDGPAAVVTLALEGP